MSNHSREEQRGLKALGFLIWVEARYQIYLEKEQMYGRFPLGRYEWWKTQHWMIDDFLKYPDWRNTQFEAEAQIFLPWCLDPVPTLEEVGVFQSGW